MSFDPSISPLIAAQLQLQLVDSVISAMRAVDSNSASPANALASLYSGGSAASPASIGQISAASIGPDFIVSMSSSASTGASASHSTSGAYSAPFVPISRYLASHARGIGACCELGAIIPGMRPPATPATKPPVQAGIHPIWPQPPSQVLPWQDPPKTPDVIKITIVPSDTIRKGTLIDLFV